MSKFRQGIKLANKIAIRPSPFILKSKVANASNDERPRVYYKFGESIVIVYGAHLTERDRGTLIVLLDLCRKNGNQPIDFKLSQIAKMQGIDNVHSESSLAPIRESVDRLFDAQIRIRPTKEHGLTAKFVFLEGYLNDDDTGNVRVGAYLDIIRDLALGCTYINPNTYFSINSQIGRSLHCFLESHRNFYEGKGYEIRLSKLIRYLNYFHGDRPWWQVWKSINKAIVELQSLKLIGKYKRDVNRLKSDGGVITFWPAAKQLKSEKTKQSPDQATISGEYQEMLDDFKKAYPNMIWNYALEKRFGDALTKLEKYLEPYTETVCEFVPGYLKWLQNHDRVKFVAPGIIDPNNAFFQEYVKEYPLVTRESAAQKERFDREEAKRSAAEDERELKRLKKKYGVKECPHGYVLGEYVDRWGWDSSKDHKRACKSCNIQKVCKKIQNKLNY